jgi:hypothetical protein
LLSAAEFEDEVRCDFRVVVLTMNLFLLPNSLADSRVRIKLSTRLSLTLLSAGAQALSHNH